jgi:hypothetical protein
MTEKHWHHDWADKHELGEQRRYTRTICNQEFQLVLVNRPDGSQEAYGTILYWRNQIGDPQYLDFDISRAEAVQTLIQDGVWGGAYPDEWFFVKQKEEAE